MTELTALSDAELSARMRRLRAERLRRAGKVHVCAQCGGGFAARAGARYCSVRCRVAACRDRNRTSGAKGRDTVR